MEKNKHTPGEWQIWENSNGGSFLTNEGGLPIMSNGRNDEDAKRICVVDLQREGVKKKDLWQSVDEERAANARLIAAAPNLLEALIHAYSFMVTDPQHQGRNILETIKTAINKATHQ